VGAFKSALADVDGGTHPIQFFDLVGSFGSAIVVEFVVWDKLVVRSHLLEV
jgi:hypothetical protein